MKIKKLLTSLVIFFLLFITPSKVFAEGDLASFEFNDFSSGGSKEILAGVAFQIRITAIDEEGETKINFSNESGSVQIYDATATLNGSPTTSIPCSEFINGIWTGNVYITEAGTTRIDVRYDGKQGTSSDFTISPDDRIKFITIVSGDNQNGLVFNNLAHALTIRVVDSYNNAISAVPVNFAISSYPPNSTGQNLSSTSATTDSNGRASTQLKLGKKSGSYVVDARINSGVTNIVHFYENALADQTIRLAIDPPSLVMFASSSVVFDAKAYDQYNNEKDLTGLEWSITNSGGTIDATGYFLAGTTLGNFANTVRAELDGVTSHATVNIIEGGSGEAGAGEGEGTSSLTQDYLERAIASLTAQPQVIEQVVVDPDFISALSGATIPITATAIDAFGNTVSGVTYDFAIQGDLGTLSSQAAGSVLLTAAESGVGTVTVSATQGSVTKIAKIVGSVGTGLNRRLVIEDIPSPQTVGEPFMISIAAKDSLNNILTTYEGPISLADTTGTLDPPVASPSASGLWYIQGIIGLANEEVTVTVAGDGMVGISNIFTVTGDTDMNDVPPGGGGSLDLGIKGASIAAQLKDFILSSGALGGKGGEPGGTTTKYLAAGFAAGLGILGASIGGAIMISRGLEALGRNPFAKGKLQFNLYGSIVAFIAAAGLAVAASILILR